MPTRARELDMLTTQAAAEVLGLSDEQLRRLQIEPDGRFFSEYGDECPLYSREKVLALRDDPRVIRARARRTGKRDWDAIFAEQYESHEHAIADAAETLCKLMFRTRTSSARVRARVKTLKRDLVRFLYENGYCVAVREDIAEPMRCSQCRQSSCQHCEWSPSSRYTAFTFDIDGRHYSWAILRKFARFAEPAPDSWVTGKHMDEGKVSISRAYALSEWAV